MAINILARTSVKSCAVVLPSTAFRLVLLYFLLLGPLCLLVHFQVDSFGSLYTLCSSGGSVLFSFFIFCSRNTCITLHVDRIGKRGGAASLKPRQPNPPLAHCSPHATTLPFVAFPQRPPFHQCSEYCHLTQVLLVCCVIWFIYTYIYVYIYEYICICIYSFRNLSITR